MFYPAQGPANQAQRRGRWLHEAVPRGETAHRPPRSGEDRRDLRSAHLVLRSRSRPESAPRPTPVTQVGKGQPTGG